MSTNGYLVPPSQNPDQEELWNETWKRIDRFLPELKDSLGLEPIQGKKSMEVSGGQGEAAPVADVQGEVEGQPAEDSEQQKTQQQPEQPLPAPKFAEDKA